MANHAHVFLKTGCIEQAVDEWAILGKVFLMCTMVVCEGDMKNHIGSSNSAFCPLM